MTGFWLLMFWASSAIGKVDYRWTGKGHMYDERNRYYGEGIDEGGERVPSKYLVNGKAVDVRLHEEDRIDAANANTQFMSRVA